MKILVINGPNLNMLGVREPAVYGTLTLEQLNDYIRIHAEKQGMQVTFFQSNCEGELITAIHNARGNYQGIVLNAGAYTHYSYALRDAIPIAEIPVIEVHLSDIHAREPFRHTSVIQPVCATQISGLGADSYVEALKWLQEHIHEN